MRIVKREIPNCWSAEDIPSADEHIPRDLVRDGRICAEESHAPGLVAGDYSPRCPVDLCLGIPDTRVAITVQPVRRQTATAPPVPKAEAERRKDDDTDDDDPRHDIHRILRSRGTPLAGRYTRQRWAAPTEAKLRSLLHANEISRGRAHLGLPRISMAIRLRSADDDCRLQHSTGHEKLVAAAPGDGSTAVENAPDLSGLAIVALLPDRASGIKLQREPRSEGTPSARRRGGALAP